MIRSEQVKKEYVYGYCTSISVLPSKFVLLSVSGCLILLVHVQVNPLLRKYVQRWGVSMWQDEQILGAVYFYLLKQKETKEQQLCEFCPREKKESHTVF